MSRFARADRRLSLIQADTFRVVLVTAGSLREAQGLARIVLKERLAACVNLIPNIQSWYWWKGRVASGKEVLLLIKTTRASLNVLCQVLKSHHSYEIPEFIALPITHGNLAYLRWLKENIAL